MLVGLKRDFYSILLYLGRIFLRDTHSKIIYYHDLHQAEEEKCTEMSTSLSLFAQHLEIVKALGYEVVTEISKPHKQIQISFDDGFRGLYLNRSYLKSEGVYPTLFVITSSVGTSNFLNWTELRELYDMGFNIQAHTHNHKDLNTLSREELLYELITSKQLMEHNLNITIDEVCFPKGLFTDEVLETCRLVGYKKCYCSIPGNNEEKSVYKELKFRNLVQFSSPYDFKNILEGGMQIFKKRYSKSHYGKDIFSEVL
jgi:peptidoglycan/xylan/chitin deacetylase (PgdA/CDA1 family)